MFPHSETVVRAQFEHDINIVQKAAMMHTSVHQDVNTISYQIILKIESVS
jgi:hypothetical protein